MPREVDLFSSVRLFFESLGYTGDGEVGSVDGIFVKGGNLIGVEIKDKMSLDLLLQGVKLLGVVDEVYIGIRKPKYRGKQSEVKALLSRLGIGLMHIGLSCEVVLEPNRNPLKLKKHSRSMLLKELNSRYIKGQDGGISKGERMTSYRQDCYRIAYIMDKYQVKKLREIKELLKSKDCYEGKVSSIMQKNYYGWFERTGRGEYMLSDKFRNEDYKYKSLKDKLEEAWNV